MKTGTSNRLTNCRCWRWLAPAALLVLSAASATAQTNYQGIAYGHFPLTPAPPPPAFIFPEDSQGWQVLGFLGYPPVTYDFLIGGQPAYTFNSQVGASVYPSPWCPSNAVTAIPVGAFGDGLAFPLWYGQLIGPDAAGVRWIVGAALTDNRDWGPGVPSSTGLFTGLESAYLGLRFYLNGRTHYGWARVGVPYAGLNAVWLYDYAYSTIPDTPIVAGLGVPDPVHMSQFIASFRATNEVPARASAHSGTGQFTLNGNILTYDLELDVTFAPTAAGIFGPASPDSPAGRLVVGLHGYTLKPPPSSQFNEPFVFGSISYTGIVALTAKQVNDLRTGWLYVNFISHAFPRGELRGQILPLAPIQFAAGFSGSDEVPRNKSPSHGTGAFILTGSTLAYSIALDQTLLPLSAGIFGPACHHIGSQNLVASLDTTLGVLIPPGGLPGQPGSAGEILHTGTITLADRQAYDLMRGQLYADIMTSRYPNGELRGQIFLADNDHDGVPDFVAAYLDEICPCAGGWSSHAQYVRRYGELAGAFAASGLINSSQFIRLMRAARASDCGK